MYIKVSVTAGAKKELIAQKGDGKFDVSVKEKAARNEANTRVRELVAKECGVPLKNTRIVNGHTHKHKLLLITQ